MNWRVIGICAVALLAMGGSSLQAALVGYWPFDEGTGTTTEDVVGSNDGAFINLTSDAWDPAGFAGNTASIEFGNILNGPGQANGDGYVDLGNLGVIGTGTVSLWVNADNTAGDYRVFSQVGNLNVTIPGAVSLNPFADGRVAVWSGTQWQTVSDPFPVSTGSWHHLAFVYQGGSVAFYVDGDLKGTGTSGFDFDGADGRLGIGARYFDTYGLPFDGRIDDVSVWDEVLSDAQIDQLAAGATPLSLVPEPASLALLGAGGLLMLRRR